MGLNSEFKGLIDDHIAVRYFTFRRLKIRITAVVYSVAFNESYIYNPEYDAYGSRVRKEKRRNVVTHFELSRND